MTLTRRKLGSSFGSAALVSLAGSSVAYAASADQLIRDGDAALAKLYAEQPKAKVLAGKSVAILVFPKIYKAGFMIGATTGDGVLFEAGLPANYYHTSSASFGFQAGVQALSLAMFFMNQKSLNYLSQSHGWSVGAGPSIVVINKGMAKSMTSTTLTQDVYAFAFGQAGLMGGIGLEGAKITQIYPGP